VLCVLAALAFTSVAGSSGGAKYKISLASVTAFCDLSCAQSIVVKRLDDDHHSCRPFIDHSQCKWTARAGTNAVFVTYADPPLALHTWSIDCSGNGKCTLLMDSDKSMNLEWFAPP
jgi:hypothetical protein